MASSSRRTAAAAEVNGLSLPVGFRFHPTEHELVSHYLVKKIQGSDYHVNQIIREIDICNHEPRDLPKFSMIKSDDKEWFFYSRPDYKQNNRNPTNRNRSTTEGYWKITGTDRVIKARDNRTVVGKKRTLTFYTGRVRNGQKTNWVIHEYYIPAKERDFVLCRLKEKSDEKNEAATSDKGEPSTYNASDFENQQEQNMEIPEDTEPLENQDYFELVRDLLLGNAHATNQNYELQSAIGTNETDGANETDDDLAFVNSIIVDPYQEATHTVPQSFRREYAGDGGVSSKKVMMISTDVMLRDPILSQTAPFANRQAASFANVAPKPQTDRLQLVREEQSGTYQRTGRPQHQPRSVNVLKDSSSDDEDEINRLQLVPNEYYTNERARRRTYPPDTRITLGKPRELKLQQIKAEEAPEPRRAAVNLPQKMNSTTMSNNDTKVDQGNTAEKGNKQTQKKPTARNWKGSFISWKQTSPVTSPPSVYVLNMVVGAILFLVFAREAFLYGTWC